MRTDVFDDRQQRTLLIAGEGTDLCYPKRIAFQTLAKRIGRSRFERMFPANGKLQQFACGGFG